MNEAAAVGLEAAPSTLFALTSSTLSTMASTLAQVARVALTKGPSHARVVVPTAMAQKRTCK